ncbi:hypothetical protein WJX84_001477 [Apatococcus fuscideae]|uniref:Fatty acid hydroxylase domain-containing protein n=1 Tax=Apatococcus fuscideae TaxID=2026836 RepID=A0AAW1T1Z4_9CHLO
MAELRLQNLSINFTNPACSQQTNRARTAKRTAGKRVIMLPATFQHIPDKNEPGTPWEAPTDEATLLLHKLRIGQDGHPMKQRRLIGPPMDLCLADALPPLVMTPQHQGMASGQALLLKVLHLGEALMARAPSCSQLYSHILDLLVFAGQHRHSCALRFLRGYSLLQLVGTAEDQAAAAGIEADSMLTAARSNLFAAASALGQDMTGDFDSESDQVDIDLMGQDGPGRDTGSPAGHNPGLAMMRHVIARLAHDLTGSQPAPLLQAERLEYFELLMQTCEKRGLNKAAAQFAHAAVAELPTAFAQDVVGAAERDHRAGRIWTNLFAFALDESDHEAAYAAVAANPVAEQSLTALRQLILRLCQQSCISTLCSLPLSGARRLQRQGRMVMITLEQEAEAVIRRWADQSEAMAPARPYSVLAAFCMSRSQAKGAAAAHFHQAQRLQAECQPTPPTLAMLVEALGASSNALSLLPDQHRWLEGARPSSIVPAGSRNNSSSSILQQPPTHLPSTPYRQDSLPGIVYGSDVQRQLRIAQAHAVILQHRAAATSASWPSPENILTDLLSLGEYDAAVKLANAAWQGAACTAALQRVIYSLAAACARLQVEQSNIKAGSAPSKSSTGISALLQPGKRLARPAQLQRYLSSFDTQQHAYALSPTAVDAMLSMDRHLTLPAWLRFKFEVKAQEWSGMARPGPDPTALLRLYMKYDRLEDAADLATIFLTHWERQASALDRQQHCGFWMPIPICHQLAHACGKAAPGSGLKSCRALEEALSNHYQDRRYRIGCSFVHPGGDEILTPFEGRDITSAFGGDSSTHRHSLAAEELLKSFPSSPVWQATGKLGSSYNDWVHCPEAGQPRFFSSTCAEAVTKTPWWTVPLVWIPIILALFMASASWFQPTAVSTAYHTAAGIVLWQFIEYSIHRFIFHAIPSNPAGIVVHFLFHGCHHKFPMDKERLVFPPLPAASIASLLYLMVRAATCQASAVPIFAGVLIGYLMYDMQHYAIHHGQHNLWLLRQARQNHLDHHYKSPLHGFGISSGLVDFLLSTCPPKVAQQRTALASC